ncbi:Uncharacterized protein OBRU01_09422 [Operophtera brumata]|uniref:C2H2-type domain-containing protein n=1 Tax=Operophtera brumata TaxID=104452 RepID=A0A0L7L2H2_OPEBR|nr:Uncharacterized protein OBRU01_09422 [Operophtera brumata]
MSGRTVYQAELPPKYPFRDSIMFKEHEDFPLSLDHDVKPDTRTVNDVKATTLFQEIKRENLVNNMKMKVELSNEDITFEPEYHHSFKDTIVFKQDLEDLYENHSFQEEITIGPEIIQRAVDLRVINEENVIFNKASKSINKTHKRSLIDHMMLHMDKKRKEKAPVECELCFQKFTRKFSLKLHMQTHTMPKKFVGENSKAVAARARKENVKQEKDQKVKKMVEDAEWEDNDDKLKKKQQKKDDQEKKRLEQLQKKAEAKAILEKEMDSIKVTKAAPPPPKITRAHITHMKEKTIKAEQAVPAPARVVVEEPPLEENLNRIQLDGEVAQTIDEALSVLGDSNEIDKHPEKRMKAAYNAFEEINLPRLKAENPGLRLSQLKQLIWKEWLKSPQNPINQRV